jgi:general secretion pathway protein N
MKRIGVLVTLGVLAYLVFALATLPASVILDRLEPYGVRAGGVTGTVWNGSAGVVQVAQISIGSLTWKLHVLPLFTLRGVADINVRRADGFAQGTISLGKNRVELSDLTAAVPIAALPPHVAPGGWTGTINAHLTSLTLENNWPTSVNGTVEVMDLTGPVNRPVNIGSYRLRFPAEGAAPDTVKGAINDISGPVQIAGTIELKAADRSYLLDGLVATKPDAPGDFARTLEYLGPPDAQGRRPFSLSGTM